MNIDPETAETVLQYAFYFGFIGMGFGALIGIGCRAIMAVVNIFNKVVR